MKSILFSLFLAIPCIFPAGWRIVNHAVGEPAGLLSDLGFALILFAMLRQSPRWLKAMLLVFWALTQIMSQELLAAMHRLPSWQDLQYLFDPTFVENTTAGLHLANPIFVLTFLLSIVPAVLVPPRRSARSGRLDRPGRPGWRTAIACLLVGLLLLGLHSPVSRALSNQSVAARYNPMHWFITDAAASLFAGGRKELSVADLPASMRTVDLAGKKLLGKGRAKNVLIVILEGIPGIYLKENRDAMHVTEAPYQMQHLEESTLDGMLIPDFVDHSHQTIRGLYALHCGDFSKLSYEMPKAMELLSNPERAGECLPAQMSREGWQSHYLQGAGLQFMNKEKDMPAMGFQHVHGVEWFTERTKTDFIWGTTDEDFFNGARKYIGQLQAAKKPWLLSLLTVATHQPFAVTEEQEKKYGSRLLAAVAMLDEAVGPFVEGLRKDGVLDDTLVFITSDESHGEEGVDWISSWGLNIVLAPEHAGLPRIKKGSYGMVDFEASILDYFDLPMPSSIIGRSFFRDYDKSRDMASFTTNKLRWHTADDFLYECGIDGTCRKMQAASIIGPRPEAYDNVPEEDAEHIFSLAAVLDHKLSSHQKRQVLEFGNGEIRKIEEKVANEWTDNLTGAQYLDFPAKSKVHVDIRLKAVAAPAQGIQLHLNLRTFENEIGRIEHPPFPLLHTGEEAQVQFEFTNPEKMQAFSFHLFGDGQAATIKIEKFEVIIDR